MSKHAYMIISHNQFELLELLVRALDDERNDIFIHIDAKVNAFDFDHFANITRYSDVIFTEERVNVTWGDFSQARCEMALLNTALKYESSENPYSYYHLLSGVDLPIKSNDEIHNFFDKYYGKEFIHHSNGSSEDFEYRIKYYHLFRKKRNTFNKILAQVAFRAQKLIGVNRLGNKGIVVQKGCNWFSITSPLAHYISDFMRDNGKMFAYSYCVDEIFVQTIVENSPFKDKLFMSDCNNDHYACARLIDWDRGNPYVWRKEDYEMIKASPCMFARKFDLEVDKEIIKMLTE